MERTTFFYLDTGALVKLYVVEAGSEAVQAAVCEATQLTLNPLQHLETRNALFAAAGRGLLTGESVQRSLANFEEDIRCGFFQRFTPDWAAAWQRADALAVKHTGDILCRTLDILHVALAELAGAGVVVTGDRRQAALCERIGLEVIFIDN